MSLESLTPWGAAINAVTSIIERVIPDPAQRDQAKLAMLQMDQNGIFKEMDDALQVALAQNQTNAVEATSNDVFKSGWRPFAGWVCGVGLLYQFLFQPLMAWGSSVWHIPSPPPIDLGTLITLLMGMLGLGSLRSVDKKNGVA